MESPDPSARNSRGTVGFSVLKVGLVALLFAVLFFHALFCGSHFSLADVFVPLERTVASSASAPVSFTCTMRTKCTCLYREGW